MSIDTNELDPDNTGFIPADKAEQWGAERDALMADLAGVLEGKDPLKCLSAVHMLLQFMLGRSEAMRLSIREIAQDVLRETNSVPRKRPRQKQ